MTIADELETPRQGNHDPLALTSPLPITKDGRDPLRLEAIALLDAYAKAYAGANNHGLEIERPTVGTLAKWMASREFTAAETAEIPGEAKSALSGTSAAAPSTAQDRQQRHESCLGRGSSFLRSR